MRRLALALALSAAAPGCGGDPKPRPPDLGGEDGRLIAAVVEEMAEDNSSPARLKANFATGTPLGRAEAARFARYRFDLKGKPEVTGTTATAAVDVIAHATSASAGEKVWTFVKEGERWKVKDAPLP